MALAEDANVLNSACWYRATNNLELDHAFKQCTEAVRLEPASYNAWDSRGLVNLRLGRTAEAIADYDRAIVTGEEAMSLFGRGLAKRKAGQIEAGDADIAAAQKADPGATKSYEEFGLKP